MKEPVYRFEPRYIAGPQKARSRSAWYPLVPILRDAILYALAVYAFCFAMEGAFRLKYSVGSVTEIEKRTADRQLRSKELVARQKRIERMDDDPMYEAYFAFAAIGTVVGAIAIAIHDGRVLNSVMNGASIALRIPVIAIIMAPLLLAALLHGSIEAMAFYDRISPAELLRILGL